MPNFTKRIVSTFLFLTFVNLNSKGVIGIAVFQYKKPNNHNGTRLPKPISMESRANQAFSSPCIWLESLFLPPISKVMRSFNRKSPLTGTRT